MRYFFLFLVIGSCLFSISSKAIDSVFVKNSEKKFLLNLSYYRVVNKETVEVIDESSSDLQDLGVTDISAFEDSAKVLTFTSNLSLSASYLVRRHLYIKLGITTGRLGAVGFRQSNPWYPNDPHLTIAYGIPVRFVGFSPEVSYFRTLGKDMKLHFILGFQWNCKFSLKERWSLDPTFLATSRSKLSYYQNRFVYGFQTSPKYYNKTLIYSDGVNHPRFSSISMATELHRIIYKSLFFSISANIAIGIFKSTTSMAGHEEMRLYFARLGIGLGYCF